MDLTVDLTPIVARALEAHRHRLIEDNPISRLNVDLERLGLNLAMNTPDVQAALLAYGRRCEEIGELNQVCAAAGITDYAMKENLTS